MTRLAGGCVLTLDYLLLVKLDAFRRFRDSSLRGPVFLTSLLPPPPSRLRRSAGAQVRRSWRRRFTHRDRNRYSPVLPGGGGAEAGRVSVERLTAVTDRSATGISGSRPPPCVAG